MGELTAVWVSDEGRETMRGLVCARVAAVEALPSTGRRREPFMLKHGLTYPPQKRLDNSLCRRPQELEVKRRPDGRARDLLGELDVYRHRLRSGRQGCSAGE